jgi:hypothetical protein
MKTSNFITFLAIYGFITGGMMLFNASGSLQNYGVQPIDQYQIVILQYLGISNIGLALITFLSRNSSDPIVSHNILIVTTTVCISSFLKACYDIFLVHVPSNTFFWVDMSFRILIGFVCLYFAFRRSEKQNFAPQN